MARASLGVTRRVASHLHAFRHLKSIFAVQTRIKWYDIMKTFVEDSDEGGDYLDSPIGSPAQPTAGIAPNAAPPSSHGQFVCLICEVRRN